MLRPAEPATAELKAIFTTGRAYDHDADDAQQQDPGSRIRPWRRQRQRQRQRNIPFEWREDHRNENGDQGRWERPVEPVPATAATATSRCSRPQRGLRTGAAFPFPPSRASSSACVIRPMRLTTAGRFTAGGWSSVRATRP